MKISRKMINILIKLDILSRQDPIPRELVVKELDKLNELRRELEQKGY